MTLEEANTLKEEKKVAKKSGYHYRDKLTGNERWSSFTLTLAGLSWSR
jgi:hypothetical protein